MLRHRNLARQSAPEARLAPCCAWTAGRWDMIDLHWNEIQNNPKHIRALSNVLVRLYTSTVPR